MTLRDAYSGLTSSDPDEVIDALFELGADASVSPSREVLELATRHFTHEDADVRRQAVVAVGVQWGYAAALPLIVRLLRLEADDDVALAQIGAVSRLSSGLRDEQRLLGVDALSAVADDERRAVRLRRRARTELRWLRGETSAEEHARELSIDEC